MTDRRANSRIRLLVLAFVGGAVAAFVSLLLKH